MKLEEDQHIKRASLNGSEIAAYYEDQGYGFIYLPPLKTERYQVNYKLGEETSMPHVFLKGTYNVYRFDSQKEQTKLKVRVYGDQKLHLRNVDKPLNVHSSNENLKVTKYNYNPSERSAVLWLSAHDIQGETTTLTMEH